MAPKNQRISITDVAKKAGVSVTTVSFVLNNNPSISNRTRDKVLNVIQKIGYQPNINARNLSAQKTHTIAVVLPELTHIFEDPYFSRVVSGIYDSLDRIGYRLLLKKSSFEFAANKEYLKLFMRKEIDGMIYVGSAIRDFYLEDFLNSNFPFIQLNSKTYNADIPFVTVDNFKIGYLATEHLIKTGCKNITHITGSMDTTSGIERMDGFLEAMKDYKMKLHKHSLFSGGFAKQEGYDAMKVLLQQEDLKIDGIFAGNDLAAMGALECLMDNRIPVPDQIAVVGADNIEQTEWTTPPLTTVTMRTYEMATRAVDVLVDAIEHGKPVVNHTIEPELIVRQSTRPLKETKHPIRQRRDLGIDLPS